MILWDFHIVCSNSTHFPEPPYLPLNLVVSPYKENLKRNKSKILIKNTKQIQQKTKQPNKKHTKKNPNKSNHKQNKNHFSSSSFPLFHHLFLSGIGSCSVLLSTLLYTFTCKYSLCDEMLVWFKTPGF